MLIVRAPFRISFLGGGTDYFDYFSKYGGCVLSTTIDKYCYVSLRHLPDFFEHKNQVTYSKIERFDTAENVQHPLVRAALKHIPIDNIQIAYDADLPACSGIGSSSAFAVAMLQGLYAMKGIYPDRTVLAKEAIYLERDYLNEAGGIQDQIAAAFGGFNIINFDNNGFQVEPLKISEKVTENFNKNLMLAFTGFTRFSGEIAKNQKQNIPSTIKQLSEMKSLVEIGKKYLENEEIDEFGRLLDYTWSLKKSLSESITNPKVDALYSKAKSLGALGGKLLGSGGGGFLLLYVPEKEQDQIKKNMPELKFVPFKFKNSGTEIIYNDNQ